MEREKDYRDELIEMSKAESPEFARYWAPIELISKVIDLRLSLGLAQQNVADRMGIPHPRIAEIERNPGRVSFRGISDYVHSVGASWN